MPSVSAIRAVLLVALLGLLPAPWTVDCSRKVNSRGGAACECCAPASNESSPDDPGCRAAKLRCPCASPAPSLPAPIDGIQPAFTSSGSLPFFVAPSASQLVFVERNPASTPRGSDIPPPRPVRVLLAVRLI